MIDGFKEVLEILSSCIVVGEGIIKINKWAKKRLKPKKKRSRSRKQRKRKKKT